VSAASGISLVDDLAAVERTLVKYNATVMIVDSLNDYIPKVKTSVANVMKEVLQRIARMANRLHLVVILVTHFNKNQEASAQYRVLDSEAIVAACRNIFYVVADSQRHRGHLVVHQKHILGPAAPTLGYRVIEKLVKFPDGEVDKIGRLKWYKPDGRNVDGEDLEDLLRPRPHPRSPRPNSIAGALIREHLKDGPIMAERMLDFVKAAGVSKDTANRAKRELQVRSAQREQRGKNHWFWFPPDWSEKQVTAWTPNGQASK